jgi:hypothetical protein
VPLDQAGRVVGLAEVERRLAELFGGVEGTNPKEILLQSSDEALGVAIALGRTDEGGRALDAEETQLLLEGAGQPLSAAVMTPNKRDTVSRSLHRSSCKIASRLRCRDIRPPRPGPAALAAVSVSAAIVHPSYAYRPLTGCLVQPWCGDFRQKSHQIFPL